MSHIFHEQQVRFGAANPANHKVQKRRETKLSLLNKECTISAIAFFYWFSAPHLVPRYTTLRYEIAHAPQHQFIKKNLKSDFFAASSSLKS